jgi:hypothetical protein
LDSIFPIFLLTFIIGCASLPEKYPILPDIADPQAYLSATLDKIVDYHHLAAIANLKVHSSHGKLSIKAVIIVQKPTLLRLETLDFFSRPSLIFITDGELMDLFSPSENTLYSGDATRENLALFFGVSIEAIDAVHLFLGFPPILEYDASSISWKKEGKNYLFKVVSPDKSIQHFWVDPSLKRIVKYILFDAFQEPISEFSFNEFKSIDEARFPHKIELKFFLPQTEIMLHYRDIDLANPPSKDLFSLIPPPHVKRLPIEELF